MSFTSVRGTLVSRLDEDDRGDRGWWVLTRVHVAPHWLKRIAEYLEHLAGSSTFALSPLDYRRLGTITNSQSSNPRTQMHRHHLLVMDKPLQLIERKCGNRWSKLALTERGMELAHAEDIGCVLEESLSSIRFAKPPWSPPGRVNEYNSFDVPVYDATMQVLSATGGYIDRNEFDFFLSRIRVLDEVDWAVKAIAAYRNLDTSEQNRLHKVVRDRLPNQKAYQNWRDMGLHTFSLFSLGTSMVRSGHRLLLTDMWVQAKTGHSGTLVHQEHVAPGSQATLRIPEPPEASDLLAPPATPASNDGTEAESFVAKVLRSQGWQVAFYTNRRGYGFDLWARKDCKSMVIEVKSSIGQQGAINMTLSEYLAAKKHGASFVLAIVEHLGTASQRLTMIQDPVKVAMVSEQATIGYRIARKDWLKAAS